MSYLIITNVIWFDSNFLLWICLKCVSEVFFVFADSNVVVWRDLIEMGRCVPTVADCTLETYSTLFVQSLSEPHAFFRLVLHGGSAWSYCNVIKQRWRIDFQLTKGKLQLLYEAIIVYKGMNIWKKIMNNLFFVVCVLCITMSLSVYKCVWY